MPSAPTPPAVFFANATTYQADTCEPLKQAAQAGEVRLDALARRAYPGRPLPDHDLTELCTAGYWDAPRRQRWGLPPHRNEGLELTYLARGRTAFAVEDRAYELTRGDLTVTRPWQRHSVGDPQVGACKLYWLILDVGMRRPNQSWTWPDWVLLSENDRRRLSGLLRGNEQPVWRADRAVGKLFERMDEALADHDDARGRARLKLLINELLLALLDMFDARRVPLDEDFSTSRRTVEVFLAELPRHLRHPWTLDAMAAECGLGRSRFAHYCRELTNMTPAQYLNRCRIDAAQRILRESPDRSITAVALDCGFAGSQYFATVFKTQTGRSPRDYRAEG